MELLTLLEIAKSIAKRERFWSRLGEKENTEKLLKELRIGAKNGKLQTYSPDSGSLIITDEKLKNDILDFWTTEAEADIFFSNIKNTILLEAMPIETRPNRQSHVPIKVTKDNAIDFLTAYVEASTDIIPKAEAPQISNEYISVLPPKLTLEEKAELKTLDGNLCINDIAKLRHPRKNDNFISAYAFKIAKACLLGDLKYNHGVARRDVTWLCEHPGEASLMGWIPISDNDVIRDIPVIDTFKEKHKRFYANNHSAPEFQLLTHDYATGRRCFIAAKDFKEWLITQLDYPIKDDCLIPNWFESDLISENYIGVNWPESIPQTETLADEVAVIQNGKRNFIKKEYYRLPEVAEILGCTVDDLIHLAANGKIPIIVLLSGKHGFLLDENFNSDVSNPKAINDKYGYVSEKFLAVYESERSQGNKADLIYVLRSDNSGNHWGLIDRDRIPLGDNSLCILPSDIPRLNFMADNLSLKPKSQAETLADEGAGNFTNYNDIDVTTLLKVPARQDDWFDVIADMVKAFFSEYRKLPNETQAWGRLCSKPPDGYQVTFNSNCLNMPGCNQLTKATFTKRWKGYQRQ